MADWTEAQGDYGEVAESVERRSRRLNSGPGALAPSGAGGLGSSVTVAGLGQAAIFALELLDLPIGCQRLLN
jgi:hypothetical protein